MKIKMIFLCAVLNASIYGAYAQWFQQTCPTINSLVDVSFVDPLNGWASGEDGIFNTIDGGSTWELQYNTGNIISICFVNNIYGYALGGFGNMYSTSDGGNTWLVNFGLYGVEICFVDTIHGWISGTTPISRYSMYVIHSNDGGDIWNLSLAGNMGSEGRGVCFIDTLIGCANASNCWFSLFVTTDGGVNWTGRFQSTSDTTPGDAIFRDANNGWVIATYDDDMWDILNTKDGGISWTRQYRSDIPLTEITFIDTIYGCAVGWNGTILYTNNGGASWNEQHSGTSENLYGVCFVDSLNGWVVGENGTILHTTNGGLGIKEHSIYNNTITVFQFPNPFTNFTTLSYTLDKPENIRFTVYNVQSQIVYAIEEWRERGEQEVQWNAEGLPAGMYYFRLQAGDRIGGGKMILMK